MRMRGWVLKWQAGRDDQRRAAVPLDSASQFCWVSSAGLPKNENRVDQWFCSGMLVVEGCFGLRPRT